MNIHLKNISDFNPYNVEFRNKPFKKIFRRINEIALSIFKAEGSAVLFGSNSTNKQFVPPTEWEKGIMFDVIGTGPKGLLLKLFGPYIVTKKKLSPVPLYKKDGLPDEGVISYILRKYNDFYFKGINVLIIPDTLIESYSKDMTYAELPTYSYDGKEIKELQDEKIKIITKIVKEFNSRNFISIYFPDFGVLELNNVNPDLVRLDKNGKLLNEQMLKNHLNELIKSVEAASLAYLEYFSNNLSEELKMPEIIRREQVARTLLNELNVREIELTQREKELEQKRKELFETKTELSKEKQEKEKFSKELDILRDDIKNNLEVGGVLHDTINNFDRIKSLANRINRALVENPGDSELLELSKKLTTLIQEAMTTIVVSQNELKGKKTKDTVFYSLSKTQGKVARKYERDYLVPYNIIFDITPNEEADMIPLGVVMLSRFIENLFLNSFRILANYETAEQKKILIYSEEKLLKLGKEVREPQKYIVVHFVDNGPGIPNERKEKIFQPGGDSTKEDKQGEHGIALPYMRKKMKEIGGYVREVGVPGKGAHFELFFPKLSPAELKEEARKNPGEARLTHDLRNAKILILDDHTEILDKYINIYSKFGSELKTGLNGKEGLDIIGSGFIPDFIQSDIEMNIMRGEDFIKEVRQRGHKMPIMVVTGNEEYIDENTGDLNEDKGMDLLEIGVNDIIIRDKAEEKIILEKAQNLLVRYLFKN